MYELIKQIIDTDKHPLSSHITFDFSNLRFIDPSGITVLSNIVKWLEKRTVVVKVKFPSDKECQNSNSLIRYLDDSAFFEKCFGEKYFKTASSRNTTMPLQLVKYQESVQWLDEKLLIWLSSQLNRSCSHLIDIKICVQELFNNIIDHSEEDVGCIFAQHYPKLNIVRISISDFGVGIPYRVRNKVSCSSDAEAINKATERGFTTKSTLRNIGAGLDVLMHNIVNNNQGSVYIHSNYGMIECKPGVENKKENTGFYPGTLFEIEFKTDNLKESVEEELEW